MNGPRTITSLMLGLAGALIAAAAVIGFVAFRGGGGSGSSATQGGDPLVQVTSGGGIDVEATLATPAKLQGLEPDKADSIDVGTEVGIILSLTTHQGDLRGFDFAGASRLLGKNGEEEKPVRWVVTSDNSHHLQGMLVFTRRARDKTELAVRGLGGVAERLFEFPGQQ